MEGRAVKLASLPSCEESAGVTKKQARAWMARAIIVIALIFIVASVSQIIRAVFGGGSHAEAATSEDLDCASKLRVLEAAIERASDRAARAPEARARAAFDEATLPEWDDAK